MKEILSDMAVIVTGAASGIGHAVAKAGADAGCDKLFLTDRDPTVAELAEALCVPYLVADLAEPQAPAMIVEAAIAAHGGVDGLVNAAGLTTRAGVADGSIETWEQLFAVNARAPFFLMQKVIADLQERKAAGSIVNILSVHSHGGAPELGIYSGTKGALATLTKNTANAHLAEGIRVNGINFGWVATPAEDYLQSKVLGKGPDWQQTAAQDLPLKRLVDAQEAARLVLFMLSDASVPMTGTLVDFEQRVTGVRCIRRAIPRLPSSFSDQLVPRRVLWPLASGALGPVQ